MQRFRLALAIVGVALIAGCARHYTPDVAEDPYGFLSGIWHGLVFPYALATNLLSWLLSLVGFDVLSSIEIVGRPNTGVFFYYIGFALGLTSYSAAGAR